MCLALTHLKPICSSATEPKAFYNFGVWNDLHIFTWSVVCLDVSISVIFWHFSVLRGRAHIFSLLRHFICACSVETIYKHSGFACKFVIRSLQVAQIRKAWLYLQCCSHPLWTSFIFSSNPDLSVVAIRGNFCCGIGRDGSGAPVCFFRHTVSSRLLLSWSDIEQQCLNFLGRELCEYTSYTVHLTQTCILWVIIRTYSFFL